MNGTLLPIPHISRFKDMRGMVFGSLTVESEHERTRHNAVRWKCVCRCGNTTIAGAQQLRSGVTTHCGCLTGRNISAAKVRHGCSFKGQWTRAYRSWVSMIGRCQDTGNNRYSRYGGRGIKVCKSWLKFDNFLADMGEPPSADHSIDRIDNNGNYTPKNCRWATRKEQCRNTRRNRFITINGKTLCVAEWAEKLRINSHSVFSRLEDGWSEVDAITVPFRKMSRTRGKASK